MNKLAKFRVFVLLLLLSTGAHGLCQVNDAGSWLSVNVQKKLSQAASLTFSQEVRLMENFSEATTVFSDFGIGYRLDKHIKLAGNYRLVKNRRLDDSYETRNRFYADLSYRRKFNPLELIVRERFQSEFAGHNTGARINPELYSRTKATLKLDLDRKLVPYAYTEVFQPLNNPEARFTDKVRYCAGIEYQFSSRHMIDFNYMIQNKFNTPGGNDFVFGFGYYLTL